MVSRSGGDHPGCWFGWLILVVIAAATVGRSVQGEDPAPVIPPAVEQPRSLATGDGGLSFIRVQVPPGRLAEVVPAGVQYVPISAAEFEEAVQQFAGPGGRRLTGLPRPAAERVRYQLRLDEAGRLVGEVEFPVGGDGDPLTGLPSVTLPIGQIDLRDCRWQAVAYDGNLQADEQPLVPDTERSPGEGSEVDLVGLPDGSLELRAPGPGIVTAAVSNRPIRGLQPQVQAVPLAGGQPEFSYRLPLVPALSTTLLLDLPAGLEPQIPGCRGLSQQPEQFPVAGESRRIWEFVFGPRDAVSLTLAAATSPRLFLWSSIHLSRRAKELTAAIVPAEVWTSRELSLVSDPRLQLTQLAVRPDDGRQAIPVERLSLPEESLAIRLPIEAVGRRWPLQLRAVLATDVRQSQPDRLPGLALEAWQWAGGGLEVTLAADLQCVDIDADGCLPIPPGEAARWPLPAVAGSDGEDPSGAAGARLVFELQRPGATVRAVVTPQRPELDIARVTTVDLTTVAVIGRAACDIRVRRGSVHRLEAVVGDGWFIDSIEPLGQPAGDGGGPLESLPDRPAITAARGEATGPVGPRYEWKVVRERRGDRLILDLPAAVTTGRDLRLRITGHRGGIPAGARFSSADVEMVRLVGEIPGRSWIDLQTDSDTTLQEIGGLGDETPPTLPPRLQALSEGNSWRQRVAAGTLTPPRSFRLLRRRPPLEVETQARFTVRGERLNETYSFVCQPVQGQLDAVTVHFSEPVGELDWSILATGEATVFARRLEPVDRSPREGPATTPWPAAASYRIEVTPPVAAAGTLRATAARPFTQPTPLPLAWVEAAVAATGEAIVQAVGPERPLVENRRLTELPPRERHGDAPLETVTEMAYDMQVAGGADADDPAAVLVPAPLASRPVARAWVWQERTTVRCFASATAECETSFELENDGRRSIQLSLPANHRLLGITVGGERMPLLAAPTGELPIFLPPGKRRLTVQVRTAAVATPQFGLWRLSTDTPTVDAPTLLREWQLLLPDSLSVAAVARGFREIAGAESDWTSRLVGGTARTAPGAETRQQNAGIDRGFRGRRFVPTAGRYDGHYFLLVDRLTLVAAAGLAALLAAGLALQISWRGSWLLLALATLLAVAALWVPRPCDLLFRSSLWAVVAVAILRLRGITRPAGRAGLVLLAIAQAATPAAAGETPLRVFFTPVDDGLTALVPQPLFRVLAGAETATGRPGTRLLDCRVEPRPRRNWRPDGSPDVWWLNLLVETDAATVLTLDQTPTESRFAVQPVRLDGGVVRASLSSDRRRLTLPLPAAGRHTVTVPLEPAWNRRGDLEVAEVRLPVSPRTSLALTAPEADSRGGRRLICEWSRDGRMFEQAIATQARESGQRGYRLPAARLLRLTRPVDPEGTLVSAVREAESRNRLVWEANACRLTAEFTIDTGPAILPSVWLQADSRLTPAANAPDDQPAGAAADYELVQVAAGVFRIDRQTPVRGKVRFEIPFTMPLTGPVGVFDLPDVWLRGVRVDHREVLLSAAADLELTVRFPGSAAPPLLEDSFAGIRWSADVIETSLESRTLGPRGSSAAGEAASGMPPLALQRQPVMLEVTRSVMPLRGRQQVEVVTGSRDTRLVYEAVIDARATVWVEDRLRIPTGFEIESCQLSEQQETGDAAVAGRSVDLVWTAEPTGGQRLVLQQPRPGRYLLRLEARRGHPLPAAGPLPLVHSEVAAALPYSVLWVDAAGQGRPELFEVAQPQGQVADQEQQPGEANAVTGVAVAGPDGTETWRIELPVNNAAWSYRTTGPTNHSASKPRRPEEAIPAPGETAAAPVRTSPSRATIELADIEIVIDERGRLSGIGRFDLTTNRTDVGLRLPEGFRLFELLVDGREVQPAVPDHNGPADIWTIPLRPSLWPREIVVVFVGELGIEAMRGEPISFEPPLLTGLPVERMIWTLDYPTSHSPRVAGEGRTATPAAASQLRGAAAAAIDRLLADLLPGSSAAAASRIERFRSLRQPERSPLEAWAASGTRHVARPDERSPRLPSPAGGRLTADPRWSQLTLLPTPERPAVTLRFREKSAGDSGRTAATLSVFLAAAVGWWSLTQRPGRTFAAASRWWPALVGLGGVAWLLTREPLWPGIIAVAVAAATLADRWLQARRERLPPAIPIGEAETIEYRRESAVGASSVTRTAMFRRPGSTS